MMKKIILFLCFISLIIISCTNVSEDDLIDLQPLPTLVTYNDNVKTTIDNNCLTCHIQPPINGATIPLLIYDNVKNAVVNSNLIGRISKQVGDPGAMPFGGPYLANFLL
jgi:hypothetical protein